MSEDASKTLLDRLADCDDEMLEGFIALADRIHTARQKPGSSGYLRYLREVAASDVQGLINAEKSYGISWKLRGGVDTFHMLLRKWERVEKRAAEDIPAQFGQAGASPYDIFEHIAADSAVHGIIDDIRDLRRYLMLGEAEVRARELTGGADSDRGFLDQLQPIADDDVRAIEEKETDYGDSWRRNGGIGAFMIFARKWDRIKQRVTTEVAPPQEQQIDLDLPDLDKASGPMKASRDNILEHIAADRRAEPILDDIRDLRQFLLLTEAEMVARGAVQIGSARDDKEGS